MKHVFDPPSVPSVVLVPVDEVVVVVTGAVVSDVAGAAVVSVTILVQTESLHCMPAGHALPHIPQFSALNASS
jgi:hypothetical protein